MTIIELLDRAKTRANLPSDYALAKALGIDRSIVSGWRKGKQHPSNEHAVQLATLAGIDEMPVIAAIEYETATTEKKKHFWKCYLEQHGITAALCMTATALSILLTPEPAQASILQLQNYDVFSSTKQPEYTLCVSRSIPLASLSGDQKAVEIKTSIATAPVLIRCAKFSQNIFLSSSFSLSASNSACNSNGCTFNISAILTAV